jgi:hypothetical protein
MSEERWFSCLRCGVGFKVDDRLIADGGVICRPCNRIEQNKRDLQERLGDDDAGDRVIFPHADRK